MSTTLEPTATQYDSVETESVGRGKIADHDGRQPRQFQLVWHDQITD